MSPLPTQLGDPLTERQRDIYEFIVSSVRTAHRVPPVREIGDVFGISSPNGVMCHMNALVKKGFLIRIPTGGTGTSNYYALAHSLVCPHCGKEIE